MRLVFAVYFINKKGVKNAIGFWTAAMILWLVIIFIFNLFISNHLHGHFFMRMGEMLQGDMNGRWSMYKQALLDFYHHPIIGRYFLLQNGVGVGFYPHNIILEVMMATGLIGLICFGGWLYAAFKAAIKIFNGGGNTWVAYLFIQYFVLSLTSFSVFTNSYFWYFSAILIWMAQDCRKNRPL